LHKYQKWCLFPLSVRNEEPTGGLVTHLYSKVQYYVTYRGEHSINVLRTCRWW